MTVRWLMLVFALALNFPLIEKEVRDTIKHLELDLGIQI